MSGAVKIIASIEYPQLIGRSESPRNRIDMRIGGGTIVDFLYLNAARKSNAATLYTINTRHFSALARSGDPSIESPG